MANYYVDSAAAPAGNGSLATPWKTITELNSGSSVLVGGDIVTIAAGTYTDAGIALTSSGASALSVIKVIASGIVTINSSGVNQIAIASKNYQRYENIRLGASSSQSPVAVSGTSTGITFYRVTTTGGGTAFNAMSFTNNATDCTVTECTISGSTGDGVNAHNDCRNIIVEYCTISNIGEPTFTGAPGDGISYHETCGGINRFNRISRVSKGGITHVVNSSSPGIDIYGNIIYDCARFGISMNFNAGETTEGTYNIYNNIVLMSDTTALIGGPPTGILASCAAQTTEILTANIYNNIVVNPISNTGAYSYTFGSSNASDKLILNFKNNTSLVLSVLGRHLNNAAIGPVQALGTTWDYNCYYPDDSTRFRYDRDGLGALAVTGATTASPIVITCVGHFVQTGDTVTIAGVVGNTAANGTFVATRVSSTQFSLNGTTGIVPYVSGGTASQGAVASAFSAYKTYLQAGGGTDEAHSIVTTPALEGQALLVPPGAYDFATNANSWGTVNAAIFKLSAASGCVNAGLTIGAFNLDYFGNTRPQGTAWDIGPSEFTNSGGATNSPRGLVGRIGKMGLVS